VFDRFYRADAARALPGSGLGLSIVRQVATGHGGRATVDRSTRGGALLSMFLPVVDAEPSTAADQTETAVTR
jgi:two-component system sensor histidine kinase MprB